MFLDSHRGPFGEIGYPRSLRRERPEVPDEITDAILIELCALLGPDLGEDGEAILRRVGRDEPSSIQPAVEALLAGRSLAMYGRGLLASLTEAYYLDDEEDGYDFYEDGIRDHSVHTFGVMTPLAAWYRGPFMDLFSSDIRNGVAVLNRLLNHAALARARTLADRGHYGLAVSDEQMEAFRTELEITAVRRQYVGDGQVWDWYRATGVGPYPCQSGLQALEVVCDQLIELGAPLSNVVSTLLTGCENLAMVGLVVGLLVRHLENVGGLLDPYLREPMIWQLEFARVAKESSGLAAASNRITAPERRQWSLREAAMFLVLRADGVRVDELRVIGQLLVANARRLVEEAAGGE